MDKPFKIAILGAGRWGTHLIRNFLENPQTEVVAVVDPNPDRLEAMKTRYQLPDSVQLTEDWQGVLGGEEVELAAIATPASTHYEIINYALRQNCHVLAEKPLTLDAEECLELCRLAEQQQCQLMVDHTYLFHPVVQRGKEILSSGAVGELRYGYATRTHLGPVRQDVNALWDLAIHDLAIFNHWLGETPVEVEAIGDTWLQPGLPDVVWVKLIYPSGFKATLHLCWLNPDKQRRLAVVGSQGTLIFDELSSDPLVVQQGHFEVEDGNFTPVGVNREVIATPPGEPLKAVCDRFIESVEQSQPYSQSSGWVGADLVRTLQQIQSKIKNVGNGELFS
ncbi:Gfo/Idh/MocA family protein [Roseofilum capinflatum]|uniref:Gfo/Idh/MocA family oxidoreductase n=1 Tax=Roseofilum capinflatum BLCC-M114 TaxID=3022440 RepID=A0ABT7B9P2_9CYAN|nr:Gfo/Idh/MocA family oxidoreductase [Roseofilum capinflatum]MDJ1175885.1 Gfo/Idh/MocA family oxidoreductase [Roseofilum capinflatum BLCC-M114]